MATSAICEGALAPGEPYWVRLHDFLSTKGYRLRRRYDPDWQPSWLSSSRGQRRVKYYECEDSINPLVRTANFSSVVLCVSHAVQNPNVLDAIRIADGLKVVLKRILSASSEHQIASYFSSPPMRSHPRNRTVPILEFIVLPNDMQHLLVVMPYLRCFDTPPFHCRKEVVDAFRQFLQGLEFMHEHGVAHRYFPPCDQLSPASHDTL
jgi:serine/threonine protein kinase